MRHRLRQALAGMTAVLVLLTAAACAANTGSDATPAAPASTGSASDPDAEIYVQVLRRYLSTPSDNSFPDRTFAHIFVLDRTVPSSGDPQAEPVPGVPIPAGTQQRIVAALADIGPVSFVADRNSVLMHTDSCPEVKDGGVLVTVGPAAGDSSRVEVGVNGFVACLGATWLTYVVEHPAGGDWRVTGTTGSMSVA